MHGHAMNDRRRELHAMLASLGHASRFRIALSLLEGERCVGDLALAIGLSQSCTTRHVQALERAGVVRSHRDGKRVLVGLEHEREGLSDLMGWLAPDAGPGLPAKRARRAPKPPRAARQAGAATAPRRETARRAARSRDVPPAEPAQALAPSEEAPPRGEPASGTHPAPGQATTTYPRRFRDTLEDFLL